VKLEGEHWAFTGFGDFDCFPIVCFGCFGAVVIHEDSPKEVFVTL